MKRKMKYLILLLFIFLIQGTSAQKFYKPWINLTTESNSLQYKLPGTKYTITTSPLGTKFLNETWTSVTLYLENGDRYADLPARLNTFDDDLIVFNYRLGIPVKVDKDVVSSFDLLFDDGDTVHFKKIYFNGNPKADRYFRVLHEGKLKILLWYNTSEKETDVYTDENGTMHTSKYIPTQNYFLVFPTGEMKEFLLNKRSFLSLFPEKKRQIRQLIRHQYLMIRTEDGIIRAVGLIEQNML